MLRVVMVVLLLAVASGVCFATDYYVATTGNDLWPGTLSQPFRTVAKGNSVAFAGDTVYVRAGTYAEMAMWSRDGVPGSPIRLVSYDGDLAAHLSDGAYVHGRQWITIEGLEFSNGASSPIHVDPLNRTLFPRAAYVEIKRCYAHNPSQGGDCMKINNADYVLVEDCEAAFNDGEQAIDFGWANYCTVRRTYVHNFVFEGVLFKGGCLYNWVEQCVIGDSADVNSKLINYGGITTAQYRNPDTPYASSYTVARNNILRNSAGYAMGDYECWYAYFCNNTVHNVGTYGIINHHQDKSGVGDGGSRHLFFYNNIFMDTDGDMPIYVHEQTAKPWEDWNTDYNNFWNAGNPIPTGGMFNPNAEPHSTFGNPNLANPTGTATTYAGWIPLYRLTAASTSCIDMGTSWVGTDPRPGIHSDMEGNPRPQGGGYDIGAFEYGGGGGTPPVANFTGNPTSGTAPLTVAFTDTSTNSPTSWSWAFGDGGTSTAQSPSHAYAAGTYTVSLTATNAYGSDGETKTNYITASSGGNPPVANFTGNPTSGTAPLNVAFTDTSTNSPTSWSWTFGDGGTSTAQNPSHSYAAGTYTVTLTATNQYGSDGETKTNYITASSGGGSAPTFVAAGSFAHGPGQMTPALPAGIAANDILLLFVETANEASSVSNQNGGTWAEVTGSPQGYGTAAAADATRLTVFWSRYNGTQGAPTVSDSGNHQVCRIIAIRGAAVSGNPWDVTAGATESTVDTSGAIPGAATTVANTLVVAAIATSLPDSVSTTNFSAWANGDLTSVTEQTDNTGTSGNGGGLGVATGVKATAGTYGSTAVTCATATTKAMLSLAIKP